MFLKRKMNDSTNSYSDKILQIKDAYGNSVQIDGKSMVVEIAGA